MAERPLNERFIDLEDRMISVEALTRYGTANDLRFYIFDYAIFLSVFDLLYMADILGPFLLYFPVFDLIFS